MTQLRTLQAHDPSVVARGVVQVEGHNAGSWEVRSESRWSALLSVAGVTLQASSKDDLKDKIARALNAHDNE